MWQKILADTTTYDTILDSSKHEDGSLIDLTSVGAIWQKICLLEKSNSKAKREGPSRSIWKT